MLNSSECAFFGKILKIESQETSLFSRFLKRELSPRYLLIARMERKLMEEKTGQIKERGESNTVLQIA